MLRLRKYTKKTDIIEKQENSNVEKPVNRDNTAAVNNNTLTYESFPTDIIGELSQEKDN